MYSFPLQGPQGAPAAFPPPHAPGPPEAAARLPDIRRRAGGRRGLQPGGPDERGLRRGQPEGGVRLLRVSRRRSGAGGRQERVLVSKGHPKTSGCGCEQMEVQVMESIEFRTVIGHPEEATSD